MDEKRYLEEGKKYIELGDAVQASEKLYKAAEEAIKELSKHYAPITSSKASKKDRWTESLLREAVHEMENFLGKEVRHYWDTAWFLHVMGFHEERLKINDVKQRLGDIEELVKLKDMEGK